MIESDRLISAAAGAEDKTLDRAIRPKTLYDYIGQQALREQLEIFIHAARERKEALDHVLFLRSAGSGQNHAIPYHRHRDGRQSAPNFRAGAGAPWRSGRTAHQSGAP